MGQIWALLDSTRIAGELMTKELYIGLMSGTSIDAIDAVLVDFGQKPLELMSTYCEPIPSPLKQSILDLCYPGDNAIARLGQTDVELGSGPYVDPHQPPHTHPPTHGRMGAGVGGTQGRRRVAQSRVPTTPVLGLTGAPPRREENHGQELQRHLSCHCQWRPVRPG